MKFSAMTSQLSSKDTVVMKKESMVVFRKSMKMTAFTSFNIVLSVVLLIVTRCNARVELAKHVEDVKGLETFNRFNPFLRPIVKANVSDLSPKVLEIPLSSTSEQMISKPLRFPFATEKYLTPGMHSGVIVNPLMERLNTPLVSVDPLGAPLSSTTNPLGLTAATTVDRFGNPLIISIDNLGTPVIQAANSGSLVTGATDSSVLPVTITTDRLGARSTTTLDRLGVPVATTIDRFGSQSSIANRANWPVTAPLISNINSLPLVDRFGLPLDTTSANLSGSLVTTVDRLGNPLTNTMDSFVTPLVSTVDNLDNPVLKTVDRFGIPLNSTPVEWSLNNSWTRFRNPVWNAPDRFVVPSTSVLKVAPLRDSGVDVL